MRPLAAGTAAARAARAGRPEVGPLPPAGARSWLAGAVSLVLAGNEMSSRRLWGGTFYDLYAGRYIVRHGLPRVNVLTAAAHGAPWIDQQWLAHVVFYAAWTVGGYPALALVSAALVTAGFAVLSLLMLGLGVPPTRMFAWTLGAFLACIGSTWIVAQSFGFLFFAVTLWLLTHDSRGPRLSAQTWLALPVLVLWANTHGSVLLGAGMVAAYCAYRAVAALSRAGARTAALPYMGLGGLAAATVIGTPYGAGVLPYYASLVGNPVLARNDAPWAPPSPLDPLNWGFFALVVAAGAAVVLSWRRGARPDFPLAGLTAALLALALTAARNDVWFAFSASLLAAETQGRASGGQAPALGKAFRRAAAGALGALAISGLAALVAAPERQFESLIPGRAIGVAAAIAAREPGERVLGDDWSGTAMLWLHPAAIGRVGFDARMEQYSLPQLSAFFDFLAVRGARWTRITRGYRVIVASRMAHPRLAGALVRLRGWQVVYQDAAGLVLVRLAG